MMNCDIDREVKACYEEYRKAENKQECLMEKELKKLLNVKEKELENSTEIEKAVKKREQDIKEILNIK